ncbi:hypothetical protein KIPB_016638, partial [Kipferlia bialata]|eukprot:g16638.t1
MTITTVSLCAVLVLMPVIYPKGAQYVYGLDPDQMVPAMYSDLLLSSLVAL